MNEDFEWIIERFDELPSTNEYLKEKRADGINRIAVSKRQSDGRGTKGRSFSSSDGGLYLSMLTFYKTLSAKEAFSLMAGAAVAVCETLLTFGLSPVIKWSNDVHVGEKKICGILIENVFSGEKISSSVTGVGLNVNNVLPEELSAIATTMAAELGGAVCLSEVEKRLVEELKKPCDMNKYLSYLGYMGEQVTLILGNERVPATLLSVDRQGGLWVELQGEKRRLTSAEVSVRL